VSRRALTLLLSGVLAVLLTAAASAAPVPYVSYAPGPTFDTLSQVGGTPVIDIQGREVFPDDGRLDLTTISVFSDLTLTEALRDWFRRDRAVVPRELVFPPGQSAEEVRRQNAERLTVSESSATTAALRQLGIPVTTRVVVASVQEGLPADGALQPGDVLTAINGTPVSTAQQVSEIVSATAPGTQVRVRYVRDGAPAETVLTTAQPPGDERRSVIGVTLTQDADYPFEVTITLNDVGGPSAGLMFALGIVEKLTPESLTGGRYIAGTGEIAPDGDVGPIGGISQKIFAAQEKGADAFLVPEANCAEAVEGAPDGIRLVRVTSLDDAVMALATLRDGGTPPSCDV
jgi:PDZ domain-containing protein